MVMVMVVLVVAIAIVVAVRVIGSALELRCIPKTYSTCFGPCAYSCQVPRKMRAEGADDFQAHFIYRGSTPKKYPLCK